MPKIIGWWSAGVTSAVACKIAIEEHGVENVVLYYFKIDTAHEDNVRFMRECEEWYGLKKNLRLKLERETEYSGQVFGFEFNKKEINRALRFQDQYPDAVPMFPLIERQMDKPACIYYLEKNGIERPMMYKLGYPNNNCKGCVKGGMGYWNKIRVDFPPIFTTMAETERDVGASCINGVYLDELDPERGRDLKIIMPDCGKFCDIKFTEFPHKLLETAINLPFIIKSREFTCTYPDGDSLVIDRDDLPLLGEPLHVDGDFAFFDGGVVLSSGVGVDDE